MKIILLRHEKRENYPGFFCNLTEEGFIDSIQLIKKFKKYKIDEIYCSPMVRTLQTIYSYCKKYNKKVNIEYGLYEYKSNPYFLFEPSSFSLKDINNNELTNIVNNKYSSIIQQNELNIYFENENHLENRIKKFLNHLIKYKNTKYKNKTILFVSHKGLINKIKQLLKLNVQMNSPFPKGHFEVISL